MAFRPTNPYDTLVQQLLQNVQQTRDATEQGLFAQRDERLIGEQRTEEQRVREQQRTWQQADYSQQRQDLYTDQAETNRLGLLTQFQQLVGYVRPSDPEYGTFSAALTALAEPTGLTGRAAWDQVLQGRFVLNVDGSPTEVSIYGLLADAARRRDNVLRVEGFQDQLINDAVAGALDTRLPDETRLGWINSVVGASFFDDETKDMFLQAAGVIDPEARHKAKAEGRLLDLSVTQAELDISVTATTLGQMIERFGWEKNWNTWEYEKAQEQWDMDRETHQATLAMSDREAFANFGFLPPEGARRERLAASLRMSEAALEAVGRTHWMRFQQQENLTTQALQQSIELTGLQITAQDLANQQAQYNLNRDHVFGVLDDKKAVAEWVLVAATNGDVEGIEMLATLSEDPAYASALKDIDFESLHERALTARGDAEAMQAFNRRALTVDRANLERGAVTDEQAFLDQVASRFLEEDFEVGPDGSRPELEAAILAWVNTLSQDAVNGMGVSNREELVQRLADQAVTQRVAADRSDAAKRLVTLLEAPWPDNENLARQHAAAIADAMSLTGLYKEGDIPGIVAGMADADQRTKSKLDAEAREINQRADLYYSQSIAQWYEVLGGASGGKMAAEMHQRLLDDAVASREQWTAVANSEACKLTSTDATFGGNEGVTYNTGDDICVMAHERQGYWSEQVEWLTSGTMEGGGIVLGSPPEGTPGAAANETSFRTPTPSEINTRLATRGWDSRGFDMGRFYTLPPNLQSIVMEGLATADSLEDVNAGMMASIVELNSVGGMRPAPKAAHPLPAEEFAEYIASDLYQGSSPEERATQLEGTSQAWLDLANRAAEGELTDAELSDQARKFGFMRPPRSPVTGTGLGAAARSIGGAVSSAVGAVGAAFGGPAMGEWVPDVEGVREALKATTERLITGHPVSPPQFVPGNPPAPPPAAPAGGMGGLGGMQDTLIQLAKVMGLNPATAQGSGIDPNALPGAGQPQTPQVPGPASSMALSEPGFQAVRNSEGFREQAYQDSGGVWTVGYGQTGPHIGPNTRVTREQAEQMLRSHVEGVENTIRAVVQVPLTQTQYDVLVSLVYNIGGAGFVSSPVLEALNKGDYQGAADAMLSHNKVKGKVDAGLTARRQRERAEFLAALAQGQ